MAYYINPTVTKMILGLYNIDPHRYNNIIEMVTNRYSSKNLEYFIKITRNMPKRLTREDVMAKRNTMRALISANSKIIEQ